MRATVVLDPEPLVGVEQIGPPEEPAGFVVKRHLDSWPGQPAEHEQQAEPGLHRRLGERLRQLEDTPKLHDARPSGMGLHVSLEFGEPGEALVQRHVRDHDRFDQ